MIQIGGLYKEKCEVLGSTWTIQISSIHQDIINFKIVSSTPKTNQKTSFVILSCFENRFRSLTDDEKVGLL